MAVPADGLAPGKRTAHASAVLVRMTSLELVASTTKVVALCLLSYIRERYKTCHRPVPKLPCGNLLKSVHRKRWYDPSIADQYRCADRKA